MPSNGASACCERGYKEGEERIGNRNAPDGTLPVLRFKLLAGRCQDVEYGNDAGGVKEQSSQSEMPAGANPGIKLRRGVRDNHHRDHVRCVPPARPRYHPFWVRG